MKKTTLCLWATVTVVAAGSAFIAHSWNQDNRGFLGRITGGATDKAADVVGAVTGERGPLSPVVRGTGNIVAAGVDVPQEVVQGNYRHSDVIDTEIDAESAEYEQELFPGGAIEEDEEEEIEEED